MSRLRPTNQERVDLATNARRTAKTDHCAASKWTTVAAMGGIAAKRAVMAAKHPRKRRAAGWSAKLGRRMVTLTTLRDAFEMVLRVPTGKQMRPEYR
jgi:hypothetical protein